MNGNQLFAFVILPLMIAFAGLFIGWSYGRGAKQDDHSSRPGE